MKYSEDQLPRTHGRLVLSATLSLMFFAMCAFVGPVLAKEPCFSPPKYILPPTAASKRVCEAFYSAMNDSCDRPDALCTLEALRGRKKFRVPDWKSVPADQQMQLIEALVKGTKADNFTSAEEVSKYWAYYSSFVQFAVEYGTWSLSVAEFDILNTGAKELVYREDSGGCISQGRAIKGHMDFSKPIALSSMIYPAVALMTPSERDAKRRAQGLMEMDGRFRGGAVTRPLNTLFSFDGRTYLASSEGINEKLIIVEPRDNGSDGYKTQLCAVTKLR